METVEMMVRKKNGELERFDVNKVIRGLQKACEKRPVTMEQINALASRVRQDLMLGGKQEVASQEIGDLVMKHLKDLDRIAYIRFASVYRKIEEPEDFRQLLRGFTKETIMARSVWLEISRNDLSITLTKQKSDSVCLIATRPQMTGLKCAVGAFKVLQRVLSSSEFASCSERR